MKFLRNTYFFRYINFLFVFLILNSSIEAPDDLPDFISHNSETNEIETVAELVLEEVLNVENAIPEQQEQENNQHHNIIHLFKVSFFKQPTINKLLICSLNTDKDSNHFFRYKEPNYTSINPDVLTPPPKA